MPEPVVRPMTAEDLPAVMALEKRLSPHPWDETSFADSLRQHSSWVLADDRRCLGFLVFSRVVDQAELLNIGVAPDCQGRGFGRLLLRFFIEQCRPHAATLFLEVRAGNDPALGLYQAEGFCETGIRHGYYITAQGREDAIVMALDLAAWSDFVGEPRSSGEPCP